MVSSPSAFFCLAMTGVNQEGIAVRHFHHEIEATVHPRRAGFLEHREERALRRAGAGDLGRPFLDRHEVLHMRLIDGEISRRERVADGDRRDRIVIRTLRHHVHGIFLNHRNFTSFPGSDEETAQSRCRGGDSDVGEMRVRC